MTKRLASLALAAMLSFNAAAPVLAADGNMPASEKIAVMEKLLYGTEQNGSLIQRIDSLEDDVYGTATSDAILDRIDNLHDYLDGSADKPEASFSTRLNVVEWRLSSTQGSGPAKNRIEDMEKMLEGTARSGALSARLDELLRLASYENGNVAVQQVTLPKDTVLKIEFTEMLSTRQNRAGDAVKFKAAENYYANEGLVIPKGANGVGTVKKVVQPGIFGKDGRIDIEFTHISAIDGTQIPITMGELAKQQAKSIAGAAGATIGGMIILGPIGAVGGAFVKGAPAIINVGNATFVQTSAATDVQGVVCETED